MLANATAAQPTTIPWQNNTLPSSSCSEQLEKVKGIFLQCTEAKKLWEDVSKGGNFTIQCATPGIHSRDEFPMSRKMLLPEHVKKEEMETYLIGGLVFLNMTDDFSRVPRNKCSLSLEDFVNTTQRIQHRMAVKMYEVASSCLNQGIPLTWGELLDDFNAQGFADFDQFVAKGGAISTDALRKDWRRSCDRDL